MYNSVLFLCLVVVVCTQETDKKEGCGWRNPNGVGFKTTGDTNGESNFGEFPWTVAIFGTASPLPVYQYIGGGSLIRPAVVLSTAHNVVSVKHLKVRAGEWNSHTVDEIYPYQESDVASKIIHKDFQKDDIALLFLSSPMNTSIPNVGLACLPPPNQVTPGGTLCIATRWRNDNYRKEWQYQGILKKNEPDRYMQIGVEAWGVVSCGIKVIPGVYVEVSKFRDWIDDNLNNMKMT